MKFDAIRRARTSYLEYMQIVEGKNRDREYLNAQTRLICYYNTTMKDKFGNPIQPRHLWAIGDEAVLDVVEYDDDLSNYGKKKGIIIV